MASIRKHFGGWQARVRIHGQPARAKTFQRKRDAEQWASELERMAKLGAALPSLETERKTLADAVARYVRDTLPHLERRTAAKD